MSTNPDNRPLSPFMIGPYYKPQLTSVLSITNRLTGVFLTVVTLPLMLWWGLALMSGPEAFTTMSECLTGFTGESLVVLSVLSLCYHLMNGIRHLIWDTTNMLDIKHVYQSGWAMLIASLTLFVVVLWVAA